MPFARRAKRVGLPAAFAATVALLAGCKSMPNAPCVESTDYPLPAVLCRSAHYSYGKVPPPTPASSVDEEAARPIALASSNLQDAKKSAKDVETTGSTNAVAPTGKLGLPDVLQRLIRTNPDVGIAAAHEKEQYAAVEGARAAFLPVVDANGGIGPQHQWDTNPAGDAMRREAGFSVRQIVYDFGVADSAFNKSTLAYESATSSRVAKTEQTAFDMLDLLLKVQQIDENVALTKRNIAAHDKILRLVQSSEQNGNATVADTKRVTTRLDSAKTSLIDLVTDRTNAADAFRRLTELDVDRVVDVVSRRLVGNPADLDNDRLELNPEIQSLKSQIESLREQLRGVEAGFSPNLGVEGNWRYGRQVSEPDSTTDKRMYANVLLSLRVPLYDGGLNQSARDQVRARIESAELQLDKRRRELREEAQGAARITSSDKDKTGTLSSRVAAARKVQDLYIEQFKDGSRTIFELLDAQVDLVKAENDVIAQTYARRRSQIRALLLRGALVSSIMAGGSPITANAANAIATKR